MADASSSLFRNKRRHLDITSIIKYKIILIISRYNDLNLRHCVNQIMLKGWKG